MTVTGRFSPTSNEYAQLKGVRSQIDIHTLKIFSVPYRKIILNIICNMYPHDSFIFNYYDLKITLVFNIASGLSSLI